MYVSSNKKEIKMIAPNLLPKEIRNKLYSETLMETVGRVGKVGVMCALIVLSIEGFLVFKISQEEKGIAKKLEQETDANSIKELKEMKEQVDSLNALSANIKVDLDNEYRWSEFLETMPKVVPSNVVLTSWETSIERPGWVKISGIAKHREGFLALKDSIANSELIQKMDSPLSNYVNPQEVSFELNVLLKGWDEKPKKKESKEE